MLTYLNSFIQNQFSNLNEQNSVKGQQSDSPKHISYNDTI